MRPGQPDLPAARAEERFYALTRNLVAERALVACILAVLLVPAFGFLDFIIAPDHGWRFLSWRLGCAAICAGLWWSVKAGLFSRNIHLSGYLLFICVGGVITAMIAALGGPASPYYAGLNLVVLAVALLMPWHPRHTLGVCGAIYLGYLGTGILVPGGPLPGVISNHFFLLTSMFFGVLGTHFLYGSRRRSFFLSWHLESRSKELAEANTSLREIDATKARFFANVSHELRTPLTMILAPLEAALEVPLPQQAQTSLVSMQHHAQRLAVLIDDLLEVARLEVRGVVPRKATVALGDLARQVVDVSRPFAARKEVDLAFSMLGEVPPAKLDAALIEQVIFNLLSNALKFTPEGGNVTVTVSDGIDQLLLRISDTGPGIPAERMAHLFERFGHRTESSHSAGSGLGLALVKEYVEAHDGTVQVSSRKGEGTTFTLRLPLGAPRNELLEAAHTPSLPRSTGNGARRLAAALVPGPEAAPASCPPTGAPTVLVVDDDPAMRHLIRSILQGAFDVREAVDGVEGLALFDALDPAVIVSDIGMPRLDGIGFCEAIRKHRKGANVPFLFVTARTEDDPRLRGLEHGANDYITKPFSPRELRARIQNFVKLGHYQERLRRQNQELVDANIAIEEALEREHAAREQVVRAEQLASLGRMAVEVGHEINNPATYLLGYANKLLRQSRSLLSEVDGLEADGEALLLGPLRPLVHYPMALERIVDGGERIASIVRALRTLASRADADRIPVCVDQEVDAIVALVAGEQPDGVAIRRSGSVPGLVMAPRAGLGQVLTNLISNAIKATDGEGSIVVTTEAIPDGVEIVVADDGCGMDEEVAQRIYEPFFTTRLGGEGMGVGMAIVKRLVCDEMGGRIECTSTPGEGTRVVVALPLLADYQESTSATATAA